MESEQLQRAIEAILFAAGFMAVNAFIIIKGVEGGLILGVPL